MAEVTTPSGKMLEVPMQWTVTRDGEYQGTFVPDEAGSYEVRATAARSSGGPGQPQELGIERAARQGVRRR